MGAQSSAVCYAAPLPLTLMDWEFPGRVKVVFLFNFARQAYATPDTRAHWYAITWRATLIWSQSWIVSYSDHSLSAMRGCD